ncbi:hypothetical protein PSEUBRA_001898 [Kalmanozyma brasiliensis GHG001]|uniref:Uncharacterized protein n=1 Tax=Kalmanozyma brasiliensis (strain GHG001) TaxID=1365824 RepID=V5GRA8_KALBG|nr:uncharacterized protein PSEUBRA_001898 [Kalmanozyma brasiliensis GHG001]EST08477.1 hypothetical protein PSEUBRA_001898 [Kalmanozyma brasiliensis GHG001]
MDPGQQILGSQWSNRVDALIRKTQAAEAVGAHGHVRNRVTLVGSFHSQTQQLLSAMIDEPLREISAIEGNEAEAVLTALRTSSPSKPFTISYAPGPPQALEGSGITLDRHWLQQANMQITVLINPTLSEETYDVIYDSEAVVFVTDDYALSRAAHRSAGQRGDTTHELLSRFAAKPNVHLVVNSILGTDPAHFANALESATGASVSDLVAPHLIPVRVSDALAANAALRQALDKQDQQPLPIVAPRTSTAYWDNFSSHYQRSNVGTVLHLIQHLDTLHGSHTLLAHSSAFLLQHCLDEALATTKHNLATLHQLRSLAVETDARNSATLKQSLERIWPPAAAYTGQLSSDEIQVWRPAAPGSSSAVESAMQMTDDLIERTFDTKLQWWKLVWKVDDVRKELETACAGFAASLESDLAYESGRLATLQVSKVREADALLVRFRDLAQKLGSTIEDAKRDAAMVVNEAEGYRSSRLRTIEPSTLMAPIHVRRAQLLETGGPIDALALKSRKLAVTSSAAVAVTAAGVGSASVLGSSLGLVDASAAALALDPATGMGLGLLTLTLVGWRMQGQYNKFRRRFRQDWLRLSEGLDQDLKGNFEEVLRGQIVGPSEVVASRVRELARSWGAKIQQQEAHVRAVARQTPAPLSTSQEVTQDITPRAST